VEAAVLQNDTRLPLIKPTAPTTPTSMRPVSSGPASINNLGTGIFAGKDARKSYPRLKGGLIFSSGKPLGNPPQADNSSRRSADSAGLHFFR
jgi:hypothetical protein